MDRTEKIADAKAATEVSRKVANLIEQFEKIDLGPVARMSDDERTELMTQITGAIARLDKTLIKIAISGGANLGVLSPPSLRYQALAFMRGSIARMEAELTSRDVQESAS